ncbi:MAG TPA: DUF3455 domain-containing protein [Chloroflexota bacterium]
MLCGTPGEADGRFAGVSYIQRLDTRGGAAPAEPCDPDQQSTLSVPYLAVYYFYGSANWSGFKHTMRAATASGGRARRASRLA